MQSAEPITVHDVAAAYAEALAQSIGLAGRRLRDARPKIVAFLEGILADGVGPAVEGDAEEVDPVVIVAGPGGPGGIVP